MSAATIYYVYILASRRHGTLYIGICNNLSNRLVLHHSGCGSEFVKKEIRRYPPRLRGDVYYLAARSDHTWDAIEDLAA